MGQVFEFDHWGRNVSRVLLEAGSVWSEDMPALMRLVRTSLNSGTDLKAEVEFSTGQGIVDCRLVRAGGDTIGAVVFVREPRNSRKAGAAPEWQPFVGRSASMRRLFARPAQVPDLRS